MDEKTLLDKIKKSSKNIDAPEQLMPENVKKMLEDEPNRRKNKWKEWVQWGVIAAVFALVIIGSISGLSRLGGFQETAVELAEEITEAVRSGETAAAGDTGEYLLAGAQNYREIYEALEEMMNATAETAAAAGEARDIVVEEAAAEAPTADISSDTGMVSGKDMGGSYFQTNLQELGVDEADVIKTDGSYLYVLKSTGTVKLIKADGDNLQIDGSIELEEMNETPQEMYVDGDILNIIAVGTNTTLQDMEKDVFIAETDTYTKLYTYDISDRKNPKLMGSVKQQGEYADSRKNGDMVYLFTRYYPEVQDVSEIDSYIPAVNGARLESTDIYLPEYKNSQAYMVISSVDNKAPDQTLDQKAIVSAADDFYVSSENIYIYNTDWYSEVTMTQILKFHYEDGKITAVAAGDLKGRLKDTFSLNEHEGYLRAVLTDYSGETMRNALYVLDENLEITGSIEDIAKGEDIRSARFLGDIGYFVTFRDMDPLFSVDLSDPHNPQILSELKITGFSSYLHFYRDDLLLGVGNEVDPESGEYLGIKLSMFDISNPADVKEVNKLVLKDTYDCSLFYDYKAAMIDPQKNLFGFMCDENYMVFTYDDKSGFENVFAENFSEEYYYGMDGIRGCYIGDTLYLIGGGQIRIYDMANDYKGLGKLEI